MWNRSSFVWQIGWLELWWLPSQDGPQVLKLTIWYLWKLVGFTWWQVLFVTRCCPWLWWVRGIAIVGNITSVAMGAYINMASHATAGQWMEKMIQTCVWCACVLHSAPCNFDTNKENRYQQILYWFFLIKRLPSRELTYPPDKAYLKIIFLSPRWDMLISRRVL